MKRFFYASLVMLGSIALTYSSCKKDSAVNDDGDLTSIEDNAQADESIADDFAEIITLPDNPSVQSVDAQILGGIGNYTCRTVTVAIVNSKKVVTVDFGTDGCSSDQISKKGKIIFTYTGPLRTPGSSVTITFDNYYINGNKIEGTKTITNTTTGTGNPTFSVVVSRSKIIGASGKIISWDATRTIEWKGTATPELIDDELSITGSASGTNSKGETYTTSITKPLIKKAVCRFIVSGTLEIKPASRPVRTLDYGNGDCDAKATVSVNGTTKEIFLRK